MPDKELEVEAANRAKLMREFFPEITPNQARELDAILNERLVKMFEYVSSPAAGVRDATVTALALMYMQSNIDAVFKEAFS